MYVQMEFLKQWVKRVSIHFRARLDDRLHVGSCQSAFAPGGAKLGGDRVVQKLIERFGSRVQEGPFAGMILTNITHAEQFGPYLLGVYESELDDAWQTVFRGSYVQIVDIGSKFGYYAVGLAKKYPDASVIAFDTDWWAPKSHWRDDHCKCNGKHHCERFLQPSMDRRKRSRERIDHQRL